jgi:hypothetical protein
MKEYAGLVARPVVLAAEIIKDADCYPSTTGKICVSAVAKEARLASAPAQQEVLSRRQRATVAKTGGHGQTALSRSWAKVTVSTWLESRFSVQVIFTAANSANRSLTATRFLPG